MSNMIEAFRVHMHDGRVLHWWGDGIFDAGHRAGFGSGVFEQIKYAEVVGTVAGQKPIHNGDHAQFELDHANTKPQDRPDWPLPSFDANDWAVAFMNRFNGEEPLVVDLDLMRAWFANALMRGYDEGRAGKR